MAYRHEDDYKRGKLIRGLSKSEKPRIEPEEELLEAKYQEKIKGSKIGIFRDRR